MQLAHSFAGTVRVKAGPAAMRYRGSGRLGEMDEEERSATSGERHGGSRTIWRPCLGPSPWPLPRSRPGG